jgi:hypothetical protein
LNDEDGNLIPLWDYDWALVTRLDVNKMIASSVAIKPGPASI